MFRKIKEYKWKVHLNLFLIVVEWTMFLGLCGISGLLARDVLEKFMANKSSFSIEMQEIKVQPTITICFNGCINDPFEYNKDFTIWYGVDEDYSMKLDEGENAFLDWEIIDLQRLVNWFKISSRNNTHRKGQIRTIFITFSDTIAISKLQFTSIKIFITAFPWEIGWTENTFNFNHCLEILFKLV